MVSAAAPDPERAGRTRQTWPIFFAVGVLLLGLGWWARQAVMTRQSLAGFTPVQVAGFSTFLSPGLEADPALKDRVMWRLEEQLTAAMNVLPPSGQAVLRPIRIWVDPDPRLDADAPYMVLASYFPQKQSRDRPALARQRAGDIVLSNVYGFIREHGQSPVLLHELAHGYDDRQLHFQDSGVLKAFESARTQGRYGQLAGGQVSSYAIVNAQEYFAVLTEAYFASRAETPHNRTELKAFDPQGYAAIEHAWGLNTEASPQGPS